MKLPITWPVVALAAVAGATVVALAALHQLPPAVAAGVGSFIVGLLVPSESKL